MSERASERVSERASEWAREGGKQATSDVFVAWVGNSRGGRVEACDQNSNPSSTSHGKQD